MKRVIPCAVALLVLAWPQVARADEHAFFRAFTGVSFGTKAGGLFGAAVGANVKKNVQVFGEFGRITNVLPKSVVQLIELESAAAAALVGGKASSTAKAPATYGLFGFRCILKDINSFRPFIEGGVGATRVTSSMAVQIRGSSTVSGDITSRVSDAFINSTPATKAMATFGAGLGLGIGKRGSLEIGYRYSRIFTSNPGINAHRVSGAFHVGF